MMNILTWVLMACGAVSLTAAALAAIRYFRRQSGPGLFSPRERSGPT